MKKISAHSITRRGFLKKSAATAGALYSFFPGGFPLNLRASDELSRLSNPLLETIFQGYEGNPVLRGRFLNEIPKPDIGFSEIMKWRFSKNPQKQEKKNDTYRLTVIKNKNLFDEKQDLLVWLGHASFFIRLDGVNFLIDPVFDKPPVVKRLAPNPCEISDVRNIDYLLISHSHYDHLDSDSIKKTDLNGAQALLPLNMGDLISSWNQNLKIQEAGWYQKFNTPAGAPSVYMLPAQHWSRRGIADTNQILWGSYLIAGKNKTIYFAGDTAYSPHFARTASLFPKIDLCLMPVAAYKPPYIMSGSHVSPYEAVTAFHDLKASTLVPMHYATFDLADEPIGEPVRILRSLEEMGSIKGQLKLINPGGSLYL